MIKESDCKVGMRVAFAQRTFPCNKGKLSTLPERGIVIVEWDSGNINKQSLSSLLTEAEGLERDIKLKAEQEALEAEWVAVSVEIEKKIKEAAELINQASSLAKDKGRSLSYDMYEEIYPLMSALDNAGWRTSSLSC